MAIVVRWYQIIISLGKTDRVGIKIDTTEFTIDSCIILHSTSMVHFTHLLQNILSHTNELSWPSSLSHWQLGPWQNNPRNFQQPSQLLPLCSISQAWDASSLSLSGHPLLLRSPHHNCSGINTHLRRSSLPDNYNRSGRGNDSRSPTRWRHVRCRDPGVQAPAVPKGARLSHSLALLLLYSRPRGLTR